MKYTQVLPDQRLNKDEALTYSIPPSLLPNIKIGQIVIVPFRQRKIIGLVLAFSNQSVNYKTKPVEKILSGKIITRNDLAIAKYISKLYISSLAKALFAMVFSLPKKALEFYDKTDKVPGGPNVKFYFGSDKERFKFYQKLILTGRQIAFVFSTRERADFFKKLIKYENEIISSGNSSAEQYILLKKFYEGEIKILIGTRNLIFADCQNELVIVVDDYNHFGQTNDQQPNFNSENLSAIISYEKKIEIILVSDAPTLSALKYRWAYLSKSTSRILIKNYQNYLQLNYFLEEKINEKEKRILIFNPVYNYGLVYCHDCQDFFKCQQCNRNLTYNKEQNSLHCPVCHHRQILEKCLVCQGLNFKTVGFGAENNIEFIRQICPDASLVSAQLTSPNFQQSRLIIATQKIFDYAEENFDIIIVLNFDILLSSHDFDYDEQAIRVLAKLKNMTRGELILLTKIPDHEIFQIISQKDLKEYFKKILARRKEFLLPPFYKLLTIKASQTDPFKLKHELEKFEEKINALADNKNIIWLGFDKEEFEAQKHLWLATAILKISLEIPVNLETKIRQLLYNLPNHWRLKVRL